MPSRAAPNLWSSDPALKDLDAAGAMALLDDSVELYLDIAAAFQQEISDLPARVSALLKTNLADATRALHTIKGLSLTVGANRLSDVCRQCELTLKGLMQQGQTADAALQQSIEETLARAVALTQQALDRTLIELASPEPPVTAPQAAPAAPLETLVPDLRLLHKLLTQSDLQALDVFNALSARNTGHEQTLLGIEQALKAFDFGKAVVQCDELIRRAGTTH